MNPLIKKIVFLLILFSGIISPAVLKAAPVKDSLAGRWEMFMSKSDTTSDILVFGSDSTFLLVDSESGTATGIYVVKGHDRFGTTVVVALYTNEGILFTELKLGWEKNDECAVLGWHEAGKKGRSILKNANAPFMRRIKS